MSLIIAARETRTKGRLRACERVWNLFVGECLVGEFEEKPTTFLRQRTDRHRWAWECLGSDLETEFKANTVGSVGWTVTGQVHHCKRVGKP